MAGSLYIISAPSGAGKTSLVSKLTEKDSRIQVSISSTTRPKRPGEEEGINYFFLSVKNFKQKVTENDFLEHAQVFDNYYGTSKSTVESKLAEDKDVILEIDWQGAQQVRKLIPEAVSIFILPPSLKELEKRLKGRGTDSEEVIERRMSDAVNEMKHFNEFDYLVINNNFDIALTELHSIFLANRQTCAKQYDKHSVMINELTQQH
ncbi:guanylate kinase [Hydrogenovibrio sp. 3SP14C1]|uniref:guanylate kinase n=1 Tax=Hydrogenovibrio sp. 3SP14C1 TaxID=3038774 RepID=UPI0024178375|nr:guanylate kinase [Hydrogenovibrio sp. 3SP14C1]MDG4811528.1 guanylate kinase [Hydrogenovibrio sp. 3SP14C1]